MAPVVYWVAYAATQTVVGAFVVKTLAALAIASISRSLFKPKKPPTPLSADRTLTVRESAAIRRIVYGDVRVGGAIVFIEVTGNNKYLHAVVAYAGHEIEEFTTHYFDDKELTVVSNIVTAPTQFANKAKVYEHLGTDSQTADTVLSTASALWGATHRLQGVAYVYYQLEYNEDAFPNGIPNFTARIKGKKVFDPRSGMSSYSNNAALCAADYLTDARLGFGVTSVNQTVLATAADTCDEAVALAGGGTETRYTCNGAIDTNSTPGEIIRGMSTAKGAPTLYAMGEWYVYAGEYRAPSVSLSESDMRAPMDIAARLPRRELFNSVKGLYSSPDNNWQMSDFPSVVLASGVTEDNGTLWQELDLPFTTSASRAQRLAKIEIMRARRQITVKCRCKLTALPIMPADNIYLSMDRLGWANKVFEVVDWNLAQDDDLSIGIDLTLRETDSNVYAWTTGDESTALPAATTNLPNPFTIAAPTGLYATSGTAATGAGDETYKVNIGWTAPNDQFVLSGGLIEIQFKQTADPDWKPSWYVTGDQVTTEIYQLEAGINYDCRIRSYNGIARSSWVTLSGFTISGGGALVTLDYRFYSEAVTANLDYGLFSAAVTANLDYGSFV